MVLGFKPRALSMLGSTTLWETLPKVNLQHWSHPDNVIGYGEGFLPCLGMNSLSAAGLGSFSKPGNMAPGDLSPVFTPLPFLKSTIEPLKWQFGNVLYCENSTAFVSGIWSFHSEGGREEISSPAWFLVSHLDSRLFGFLTYKLGSTVPFSHPSGGAMKMN